MYRMQKRTFRMPRVETSSILVAVLIFQFVFDVRAERPTREEKHDEQRPKAFPYRHLCTVSLRTLTLDTCTLGTTKSLNFSTLNTLTTQFGNFIY